MGSTQPPDHAKSGRLHTNFCLWRDLQFTFRSSHYSVTLGCPRGKFWAVFSNVSSKAAEHIELIVKMVLSLCCSKLAILSQIGGEVGLTFRATRGICGFALELLDVLWSGRGGRSGSRGSWFIRGRFRCGGVGKRLRLVANFGLVLPIVHIYIAWARWQRSERVEGFPTWETLSLMQSGRLL